MPERTHPTDDERDALIRVMTRQLSERDETIRELRAELVAAHEQLNALKQAHDEYAEIPF